MMATTAETSATLMAAKLNNLLPGVSTATPTVNAQHPTSN
jgi:hypothetical protein